MSMLLVDGWGPLHFFSIMCPSFTLCFSRRTNLIRHGTILPHSLRHHCFFIPHDFCSVFHFRHVSTFNIEIMMILQPMAGFAFVYMDDERDAEDAIRRLDRTEFGRKGRRLRVEWTKQHERGIRRPGDSRRSSANTRPSKTLFVINFDPINTRTRDLERHFDPYGKIANIRIRRNFAFIQYELQEDATRALDATNMSDFMDRVISVEYAVRDDDDRKNGYSPDRRGRDRSPDRRSYDHGRSPSPYHRDRASPDYGHGSKPNSRPEPRERTKYDQAESPVNERYQSSRSPPPRERSRS
ncbi:hypothetical protein L1049_019190 [Liquidambar formosana]|uniref:RRM domain-containing protein n=1 Tax=Liquidambar formosana TaxID=63359 RepID=A0AAP0WP17_LIQFO